MFIRVIRNLRAEQVFILCGFDGKVIGYSEGALLEDGVFGREFPDNIVFTGSFGARELSFWRRRLYPQLACAKIQGFLKVKGSLVS
jgi:hypothetical protein